MPTAKCREAASSVIAIAAQSADNIDALGVNMAEFESQLQRIVDAIDLDRRECTKREIDALLQAGVRGHEDLIALLADSAAGELRQFACWVLGCLRSEKALPALLLALQDPDPRLRAEA